MSTTIGKTYLIGAGPGDPGLLTLRGRQRLGEADVVLYDYLVNPRILDWARSEAELICLGRHGQGRLISQDEVHQRMVAAARSGKTVARLKGGDPAVFARAAEETAALEAAGVPYEIIPGITAAQAASSYAGVPLTHRDASSCVAFVTGQQCRDKEGESLDLEALARFPGTLVFYMGVTSAPQWSGELLAHGKPADTPVAIVRRASWPEQETIITTLGELASVLVDRALRPPALIIVGESAGVRPKLDWFGSRPLFGRTVLVTRPMHQSESLVEELSEQGAHVLVQPAIEIGPPADWEAADAAIDELRSFDWLVFSSANGVQHFLDRIEERGGDMRALAGAKLAAIGPGTADALAVYHLRADLLPPEYRAESLAEALLPATIGKRVLLLRASRGREILAETLTAAGVEVRQAVVYESRDVIHADAEIAEALRSGQIDWVTVTSSAIARSLIKMFGGDLRRAKLAAISPLTAAVLTEAGFSTAAVASPYTTRGLIDAILSVEKK